MAPNENDLLVLYISQSVGDRTALGPGFPVFHSRLMVMRLGDPFS